MKTMQLGKIETPVSCVGFGGIPIQRLTRQGALEVILRALDLGITYIDTANGYTDSEDKIGQALTGRRHRVFIATKTTARTVESIQQTLELSLNRLKTDYIDLYQFHGVNDFNTLDSLMKKPLAFLEKSKQEGMIHHIGITSHQIDVAEKAVATGQFETIMFPFNFVTPEAAVKLIPLARKQGTGFIAMKPLAGGMVSDARVAIKFLRRYPDILPLVGIEKIAEIEEIAALMEGSQEMTRAEKRQMDRIKDELGPRFCHRCDYCQPCSQKIPISVVLGAKSSYRRMPQSEFMRMLSPGIAKAATCIECGDCESRCPYHLPIREMLAEQCLWYEEASVKSGK